MPAHTDHWASSFRSSQGNSLDMQARKLRAGKKMAVDPICKMNVSENQAKYTSMHNGTSYYFCSAACKQEFDRNPSKYAK